MTRDSSQTSEGAETDPGDSHVVSARRIGSEGLEVASGRSHRIEVVPWERSMSV
jgi:hypothetical protein